MDNKFIVRPCTHKENIVFLRPDRNGNLGLTIGDRIREADPEKVRMLAEDIKINGQLVPVIITGYPENPTLLAGLHRVRSSELIWSENPENAADFPLFCNNIFIAKDNHKIIEITENLNRNELTREERKQLSMEYGQLISESAGSAESARSLNGTSGSNREQGGGNSKGWFTQWYESTNIPKNTALNWWKEYTESYRITCTPAKATQEQQQKFFAWHNMDRDGQIAELRRIWKEETVPAIVKKIKEYCRDSGRTYDYARQTLMDAIKRC